ncbi:MAG: alanine racemase [Candidatus Omnitrophota bacterium]
MKDLNTYRKTWAEIDLNAITHNFKQIRRRLQGGVRMLAAVKANAYGHGLINTSRHLEKIGADFLGTSSIDEAVELRKSGLKRPILNLSNLLRHETEAVINFGITPTITDFRTARTLDTKARFLNKQVPIHIKIDTGMGRIGLWHTEAERFIKDFKKLKNLTIEGIYTHFPSAEEDKEFTFRQIEEFNLFIEKIKSAGIKPHYSHAANSAALLNYKNAHFNLVRPGLALYGIKPAGGEIDLKPALSFKTTVSYLKKICKGRSVGYGRTFMAEKDTLIATLPVGYADGYSQLFSNKAKVLVRNKFYPVAGMVCMDTTMIDIGLSCDIKVGDEVVLIGAQKEKSIKAEDLARLCGTIPYQILCWISSRVPRLYKNK